MLTDGFCKEDRKPVQRTLKSQTMSNAWKSGLRKTKTYIQPKIIVPEQHITQMLSHTAIMHKKSRCSTKCAILFSEQHIRQMHKWAVETHHA
jgi:hypothetical protein